MLFLGLLYTFIGWLAALFINHAADMLPRYRSIWHKPSCHHCKQPRPVSALIGPIYCPHCQTRRENYYRSIIVELTIPGLFLFLWTQYELSLKLILFTIYTVILVLITVTDLEHRLIYNAVVFPGILLAFAAALLHPGISWPVALMGGFVGLIGSFIVYWVARGGFGAGDVTLSTFLGLILGYPHIILSLCLGVFLGGFVSFLLLISRRVTLRTYIPYGPFLTITGWLMLIWGAEIWRAFVR